MGRRQNGTGTVKRQCNKCSKEFQARHDRPGKYCSRSCSAKDVPRKSFKVNKICLNCGQTYIIKRYQTSTSKYCSIKCLSIKRGEKMRGQAHPNWKGGKERSFAGKQIIAKLKKLVNKCEECDSKKNLQGHHILPKNSHPHLENDETNIRILCAACHALKHPNQANMIDRSRRKEGVYINCNFCNNKFYVPKYKKNTAKYCSNKCKYKRT